jgi:hypothetical protein
MTIKHADGWTFLESRMAPGHAPPLHVHRHEEEAFYVQFIEDAGVPAPRPVLPSAAPNDHDAIARAAARHDMVVVGPPLA